MRLPPSTLDRAPAPRDREHLDRDVVGVSRALSRVQQVLPRVRAEIAHLVTLEEVVGTREGGDARVCLDLRRGLIICALRVLVVQNLLRLVPVRVPTRESRGNGRCARCELRMLCKLRRLQWAAIPKPHARDTVTERPDEIHDLRVASRWREGSY